MGIDEAEAEIDRFYGEASRHLLNARVFYKFAIVFATLNIIPILLAIFTDSEDYLHYAAFFISAGWGFLLAGSIQRHKADRKTEAMREAARKWRGY